MAVWLAWENLLGGGFSSEARGVSSNGLVVVGQGESDSSGNEAFLWTSDGGMIGLGDLPGGSFNSWANDVSADGSIVVGHGTSAIEEDEAFIWDAVDGMRNLKEVLINQYGLDLTGWKLEEATAISDDGLTIVGFGINPNGDTEAWIATLPEPVNPCMTPPDFELSISPTVLWPPNHKMVKITPTWTVTDICDESPEVLLVEITANEPVNSDDIQISDDGSIYLRAERSGNKTGRIYTLNYEAVNTMRL